MDLINYMQHERSGKIRGIYWLFQVELAFNSNKMEGSQLSEEQTQHLFDEEKIYSENGESVSLDDINETMNHFSAFDYILDNVHDDINIEMIKELHYILKSNTSDEKNPLTPIGEFKKFKNVIGTLEQISTTDPEEVESEINLLLEKYDKLKNVELEDIVDFHVRFEQIHPFADGNGRVGRLIVFKESLKHNIIPSIILDKHRSFYITGLKEYDYGQKERLLETFLAGQDYSEQILKKLNFKGDINSSVKMSKGTNGKRNNREC